MIQAQEDNDIVTMRLSVASSNAKKTPDQGFSYNYFGMERKSTDVTILQETPEMLPNFPTKPPKILNKPVNMVARSMQ